MPARHVVLVVLAGAVLVAAAYLFHAVREVPTVSAAVPTRHEARSAGDESAPPAAGVAQTTAARAVPHVADQAPELAGDQSDDLDLGSAGNLKLDAIMDQANKAYDRGDYEEAKSIALKVIAKLPTSVRMMRIMVSSACFEGDSTLAQEWYDKLPKPDRAIMKTRCERNQVMLTEPAQ
ncbi:MAG TPA: hypothetical protein VGG74_35820 [Kofleriaceae bacterium]